MAGWLAGDHCLDTRAMRSPDLVWYVSYGSNMHADRLGCYIAGGTAPGATRAQPGCRDGTPPRASRGTFLPGGIYFATLSPVWNGGRALYDPQLPGEQAAARAWLVTPGQFADIAAQEMYREPDGDLDLSRVLDCGRVELGPGRYETLIHAGDHEGYPQLTFTAPHRADEVDPVAPSAAYLRMLAGGIQEAHAWSLERAAEYLAGLSGAAGEWTAEEIVAACTHDTAA